MVAPKGPDYYGVLEVGRAATGDEIRAAYRRLAREHHPDANPGPDAEARMRRINEAWETLRDPRRRAAYDRQLPAVAPRRAPVRRQAPARPATPAQRDAAAWFKEDAPRGKQPSGVEYTGDPAFDWYAAIGVRPDAPRAQVLKALGAMATSLQGADISATEFARKRGLMREAWSVLGDQYMRAAYDRARKAQQEPGQPGAPGNDQARAPEPRPAGYRIGPVTVNGHVADAGADLQGVDLRGADLRGLDLSGVDLRNAKLQGTDFEAASLRRAKLQGADLAGANLRFADLSHAEGQGASFRQADISEAALHGTNLYRANLAGASLANVVAPGINLDYADLARADFSGAHVTPRLIERGLCDGTIFPDGTIRAAK